VQTIGELDQEHPDIVGDRQQQFAQVLGLLGLARHQLQPLQLGETLDQRADLVSEDVVDFGAGGFGILDGVVQQRRDDGGVVELEVVRIAATSSGCEKYGSPDARVCVPCAFMA